MTKRHWLIVIGLLVSTWSIDQVTKIWALNHISEMRFWGPFGIVLHRNPGAILGAFSDLPPMLRIVSLSTGGAFLIFIYGAIQYLLPRKSLMLRSGMSLLLGGILGNVTDRIISGSVVDFLLLGSSTMSSPAFNIADAIQWVGYFMIVISLIREGSQIWPNENERKQVWVNPRFQLKYCFMLVFIGLGFSVVAGVFSYTYIVITIEDIVIGPSEYLQKKFLVPFLEVYLMISLGFAVTLFLIGRILSHRTAGPLYAFELFLDDVLHGKDRPLRLRAGDEFQHLEELAEVVREKLKTNFKSGLNQPEPVEGSSKDNEKEYSPAK
ncbi:MAG: signal peptidase II [Bdellovibrionales bacterium]|nr:signal peptidase II [Bdellovibrionales bacterium]